MDWQKYEPWQIPSKSLCIKVDRPFFLQLQALCLCQGLCNMLYINTLNFQLTQRSISHSNVDPPKLFRSQPCPPRKAFGKASKVGPWSISCEEGAACHGQLGASIEYKESTKQSVSKHLVLILLLMLINYSNNSRTVVEISCISSCAYTMNKIHGAFTYTNYIFIVCISLIHPHSPLIVLSFVPSAGFVKLPWSSF